MAVSELAEAGIHEAMIDARFLVESATERDHTWLYLHGEEEAEEQEIFRCRRFIDRRKKREPFSYIVEEQEFYSRSFFVSPDVLIPRPETEILVEAVLRYSHTENRQCVLDICTGSGIIAVTLACELDNSANNPANFSICASDISLPALAVAQRNAERHLSAKLMSQFHCICTNFLSSFSPQSFSLITANPPYICEDEIAALEPEVSRYEPRLALTGGNDGLDCIRSIEKQLHTVLCAGGDFFMEFGAYQGSAIREIFSNKHWAEITVLHDYAERDRVLYARKSRITG